MKMKKKQHLNYVKNNLTKINQHGTIVKENHLKKRETILETLKQIDIFESQHTDESDHTHFDDINTQIMSHPSITKDLLIELNIKNVQELNPSNNLICSRCKNLLEVPSRFSKSLHKKISPFLEKCEADINFVQAIVWLKSVTATMQQIPIKEYQLIFNPNKKVCNNVFYKLKQKVPHRQGNDFTSYMQNPTVNNADLDYSKNDFVQNIVDSEHFKDINAIDIQVNNSFNSIKFTDNTNLLTNDSKVLYNNFNNCYLKQMGRQEKIYLKKDTILDTHVDCPLTPQRWIDSLSKNESLLQNCIIPESDEELSQNSGIFNECKTFCSSSNLLSLENTFIGECDDSRSRTERCDSAYDTLSIYLETSDFLSNINDTIKRSNSNLFINDSLKEVFTVSNKIEHQIEEKILSLEDNVDVNSSLKLQHATISYSGKYEQKDADVAISKQLITENKDLQNNDNKLKAMYFKKIEEKSSLKKRKSCNLISTSSRKKAKQLKKEISSEWINFTLEALNTNEVVIQSIQVILTVLKDTRLVEDYKKRRCWINTLENEAINAILNFCDVFKLEQKSDSCSKKVAYMTNDILKTILEIRDINKVTSQIYHLTIFLELCNCVIICIEVIDFFFAQIMNIQSFINKIMNNRLSGFHEAVNRLHLVLYALNIALRKYRIAIPNRSKNNKEITIPRVTDIWWKQWNNNQITSKGETMHDKENEWIDLLESFTVTYANDTSVFIEKFRQLFFILTE